MPWTLKKTAPFSLKDQLEGLLEITSQAASTPQGAQRLQQHLLATLLCPERATVTNLLCTSGRQHLDWSAHYRLFSHSRVDEQVLFDDVRHHVHQALPPEVPLVIALDDTIVRKRGTHVHGASWRRDPLGPAFQTNLVRAQRYLQFSAAWPLPDGQAHMVPIGWHHAPGAGKPARDADAAALAAHKEQCKQKSLNTQALQHMRRLRETTPAQRPILFSGDGSYTNKAVLCGLPAGSIYLGRTRKDAVLHHLPEAPPPDARGRRPSYGPQAPTPEELRQDESVPWQRVEAFAAGQRHDFRLKTLGPVLWRKAGTQLPVRIVVIAPLAYRLRKNSRALYRQPAYLMCSDLDLPLEQLLQYYLWRWGIEVNFREQKSLLGTGEAQVRTEASNQHLPAMSVAAYALLWVAALQLHGGGHTPCALQPPKWRHAKQRPPDALPTTGELIRQLRCEMWAGALRPGTFSHFMHAGTTSTNSEKVAPSLPSTLFCAA